MKILVNKIKNIIYKKKRQLYKFPKKKFGKILWEDNVDNLYYGHYHTLKKYSKTAFPYKINGELQHGWSPDHGIMIDPNAATSDVKRNRFYVFNKYNKKRSQQFGFENVCIIGAPFIYHPEIKKIKNNGHPRNLILFPTHTTIYDTQDNLDKFNLYLDDIKKLNKEFASITVSLGWLDYKNITIRALFEKQNINIVSVGHMNNPHFLDNYISIVKNFEYVSSDSFSSAIFYSLMMKKKTFVYGHSFTDSHYGTDKWEGMKLGYNKFYSNIYPELMWENFNDKPNHHPSSIELGLEYKKSPKELCDLFEWNMKSLFTKSI